MGPIKSWRGEVKLNTFFTSNTKQCFRFSSVFICSTVWVCLTISFYTHFRGSFHQLKCKGWFWCRIKQARINRAEDCFSSDYISVKSWIRVNEHYFDVERRIKIGTTLGWFGAKQLVKIKLQGQFRSWVTICTKKAFRKFNIWNSF